MNAEKRFRGPLCTLPNGYETRGIIVVELNRESGPVHGLRSLIGATAGRRCRSPSPSFAECQLCRPPPQRNKNNIKYAYPLAEAQVVAQRRTR